MAVIDNPTGKPPLTACVCGSTDFRVVESSLWKALVGDDGVLSCFNEATSGIDEIYCAKCDATYWPPDFADVQFN